MKRTNNAGFGLVEIILITAILGLIFSVLFPRLTRAQELQRMKFTCYCPESCPGTVTASGERVREGIMASSREHLGDCAMIYLNDGTFLGFYESLDVGGTDEIRNNKVIDVWAPNLKKVRYLMALTEGEVMVEWIKTPKG